MSQETIQALDEPGLRVGAAPKPTVPAYRRIRFRLPLSPGLPLIIIVGFVIAAVFAPWLTPYDPIDQDLRNHLLPPFWIEGGDPAHILGTDTYGRDVYARLLYGARISLIVAGAALIIAASTGTLIGVASGYIGGAVDSALMRFVDTMLALPRIIVALVMAVALGPSINNLIIVLGFLSWMQIARLLRGESMAIKGQDYTRYSRAIGVPGRAVMLRHVLPNVLPTLMVATTLEIAGVILAEASLSFLGAGVPPPSPSWGVSIAEGRALLATGWWISLFPGLAITLTVLAWNSLGDWLRDKLDPKTRRS